MKKKVLCLVAAAAALVTASVMTLPAGASHPAGFSQVFGSELRLAAVDTPAIDQEVVTLCTGTTCETHRIQAGGSGVIAATTVSLEYAFTLLGSSTHLPDVDSLAGTNIPCPTDTTKTATGIALNVDALGGHRYNSGSVTFSVNGESKTVSVPPEVAGSATSTDPPPVRLVVGPCR